jgi:hypothetical protein
MSTRIYFLLITLAVMVYSCGGSEEPGTKQTKEPDREVKVPGFNADSAYAYIAEQVEFGPRVP